MYPQALDQSDTEADVEDPGIRVWSTHCSVIIPMLDLIFTLHLRLIYNKCDVRYKNKVPDLHALMFNRFNLYVSSTPYITQAGKTSSSASLIHDPTPPRVGPVGSRHGARSTRKNIKYRMRLRSLNP